MKIDKWDRRRLLAGSIVPWYTYETVLWLYQNARPEWGVFEWGCGASTVWFSRACKYVTSVESDPKWLKKIESDIASEDGDHGNVIILSRPVQSSGKCFSKITRGYHDLYVQAARREPEASFDFVSVDGRARNHCMREAIRIVKPGGYLLLDNSDRNKYRLGRSFVPKTWKEMRFPGPGRGCPTLLGLSKERLRTWQTTIWRRPDADD